MFSEIGKDTSELSHVMLWTLGRRTNFSFPSGPHWLWIAIHRAIPRGKPWVPSKKHLKNRPGRVATYRLSNSKTWFFILFLFLEIGENQILPHIPLCFIVAAAKCWAKPLFSFHFKKHQACSRGLSSYRSEKQRQPPGFARRFWVAVGNWVAGREWLEWWSHDKPSSSSSSSNW